VAEPLAAEAPFLFDLAFFHPPDVMLVDQEASGKHPLRCLFRVKPDPY
jgi:hypothetical protein